jgi:hypothetical protein
VSYQLLYLDYLDKATGKTLVVTPGSAYTAVLASGRNTAMSAYPNDGRWTNATTFLSQEFKEPEPPAEETKIKAAADPGSGAAKDKDKGGA